MSKTTQRPGLLSNTPTPVKKHQSPMVPRVARSKPPTRQVNQKHMKGLLG